MSEPSQLEARVERMARDQETLMASLAIIKAALEEHQLQRMEAVQLALTLGSNDSTITTNS